VEVKQVWAELDLVAIAQPGVAYRLGIDERARAARLVDQVIAAAGCEQGGMTRLHRGSV
jgi:hypothetical protein